MKKIILIVGIIITSFGLNLSYAQNNNIWNYQITNSLKQKIDSVLNKFYLKLEKKYNLENRTKKLININKKIDKIIPTIHKTTIINALKYLEYKISQKIFIYKIKYYWKLDKKNIFCTMEYAPVCAIVKENSIRCIKAPCPNNWIYKTFSNTCMAHKAWYKIAYSWECKIKTSEIVWWDRDKHWCIWSAWYSWCASKNKCIRPWEEKCSINNTWNQEIITPTNYQKILWLWIDVNWSLFPKEIKNYTSKWPQDFKAKWFDNVRIRFNSKVNVSQLKKVVDDSLKVWLVPVVAFDAADFKNNPDEQHLKQTLEIWKEVANSLKNESYKVSFDLMIEPWKNLKKSPEMLYKYYETIVPMIRNILWNNKNRIIFLAPNHLANPEYLQDLTSTFQKLNDKYLMAEFHFLAAGPFRKTNSTWKRLTWNGTWTTEEREKIENKLKIAVNWQKQTWIKIWFGAWMPWNYNHTNDGWNNNYSIPEQVSFSTYFESLLKKYQIPNDINADQQFYDSEKNIWRMDRLKVIDSIINTWKK